MTIKEGTPIYTVEVVTQVDTRLPTKILNETHGRIVKRQEPFVYLSCPGGLYFWVDEKYLIYPEVS